MFFSDLDRTIIYSTRFLSDDIPSIVPVETKEGREISYMTRSSLQTLQELRKKTQFVPVTARKWDEIMRIHYIREDIPSLMVCEAGRVVYQNGKRDTWWDTYIHNSMSLINDTRDLAYDLFRKELEGVHGFSVWNINEYMMMTKVEHWKEGQKEAIEQLIPLFDELHCHLLIQERKVYLIPWHISKKNAIRYLITKFKPEITVSAGDAEMDAGMFSVTTYHIAPNHHEIKLDIDQVTKATGLLAGDEILAFAKERLCR